MPVWNLTEVALHLPVHMPTHRIGPTPVRLVGNVIDVKKRHGRTGTKNGRVGPPGRPKSPARARGNCVDHGLVHPHLTPLATNGRARRSRPTGVMCPHPPPHQWLRRNLDSALAQAQPPHRSLRMGGEIRQIRVEPSSCVIGSPTCARTKRFRSSLPQGMMRDSNHTGRRTNSPCSREGPSVDGTGYAACHYP